MNFSKAWQHLNTINHHKMAVMTNCFRMGLIRQGLLHDLSKYAPVEFRTGAKYYQGDRSPNNAEREDIGLSYSWLHHKGRNKHHFEYWIDYGVNCKTIIKGVPMPRRYVAEMVADRVGASKVYLGSAYSHTSPYLYLQRSLDHLWFVHDEVKEQLQYLLGILAVYGEKEAFYDQHEKKAGGPVSDHPDSFFCAGDPSLSHSEGQWPLVYHAGTFPAGLQ